MNLNSYYITCEFNLMVYFSQQIYPSASSWCGFSGTHCHFAFYHNIYKISWKKKNKNVTLPKSGLTLNFLVVLLQLIIAKSRYQQRSLARSVPQVHRHKNKSRIAKTTDKDLRSVCYMCWITTFVDMLVALDALVNTIYVLPFCKKNMGFIYL